MQTENTCVVLGSHFDRFIAEQLASGRYASADEVIRAALRLLEETGTDIEKLRPVASKHDQNEELFTKITNNDLVNDSSTARKTLFGSEQIKNIQQSLEAGKSKNQLAQEYGVSVMAISRAARARIPRDRSHLKKLNAAHF